MLYTSQRPNPYLFSLVISTAFVAGCQTTPLETSQHSETRNSEDIFEIQSDDPLDSAKAPELDNPYIALLGTHRIYSRPLPNSPEVGRVTGFSMNPKVLRTGGFVENDGRWYSISDGQTSGYIKFNSRTSRVLNYEPPRFHLKGSYDGFLPVVTGISPVRETPWSMQSDVSIGFINPSSGRSLKYVHFLASAFDSVGDRAEGLVGKDLSPQEFSLRGPVEANSEIEVWQTLQARFNGEKSACVEIDLISFEYFDGSIIMLEDEDINLVSHDDWNNSCAYSSDFDEPERVKEPIDQGI